MNSLYNLTNDYLVLQEMAQSAETAEDVQALEDTIASIADAIEVKGENYAKLIKSVEGENATIAEEIKRLQGVKKRNEALVEKLKNNMDECMKAQEVSKIKCGTFTFGYRKSKAVEILDIDAVPNEFKAIEYKANKTAIKKAIENGEVISGAELVVKMNVSLR